MAWLLVGLEVTEGVGEDAGTEEVSGLLVEEVLGGVMRITFAGLGDEESELSSAKRFFTA